MKFWFPLIWKVKICNIFFDMNRMTFQKGCFRNAKAALLACDLDSFARRFATYCESRWFTGGCERVSFSLQ